MCVRGIVPSQNSQRSCKCVLGVLISPLYTTFLMDFRFVSTMNFFFSFYYGEGRAMVLKATFNNISAILWRSVLLVEETGGSGENHKLVTSH